MAAQDPESIKLSALSHTLWFNTLIHRPVHGHQMWEALWDLSNHFAYPLLAWLEGMWEAHNSGLQRWRMFSTLSAITTPIVEKKGMTLHRKAKESNKENTNRHDCFVINRRRDFK